MSLFSCLKRWITISFSIVFIVGLSLFCSTGSVTYARGVSPTSFAHPQKSSVSPSCGTWSVVPSASPGALNLLFGVAAISANDVWTVGYYADSASSHTLTEHWNGTRWNVIASPDPGMFNTLTGVTAISANDVWAAGYYQPNSGSQQTLIEHWNGTQWSVVPSPSPTNDDYFNAVSAASPTDVWAVGETGNLGNDPLVEHWNGTNWNIISSPGNGIITLNGVTAISASNAWIVGRVVNKINNQLISQTLTEHWNGKSWSVIPSPNEKQDQDILYGAAVVPATNQLWAVGIDAVPNQNRLTDHTLAEHWNGARWSLVHGQDFGTKANVFAGVAALSAQNVWAVGYYKSSSPTSHVLIENWNGTTWRHVSSPKLSSASYLNAITSVPQTNTIWAVGSQGVNTLIETYC